MSLEQELREAASYESLVTPTRPEIQVLMHRAVAELESRDQRIRELERAAMDVILSDEYGDHHVPNHDALAALFPNIKRGYWP